MKIRVALQDVVDDKAKQVLDKFCKTSGIYFVCSGKLTSEPPRIDLDCIEYEAWFDSRAWTGLA